MGELFDSQRVTAANDLFSWTPAAAPAVAPTLPPFAEECDYIDQPFVRPILNQPDIEVCSCCLAVHLLVAVADCRAGQNRAEPGRAGLLPPS